MTSSDSAEDFESADEDFDSFSKHDSVKSKIEESIASLKTSNQDHVSSITNQQVDNKSSPEQDRATITTCDSPSLKENTDECKVQPSRKLGKKVSNIAHNESSLSIDQNEKMNIPERQVDDCYLRNDKQCLKEVYNEDKSPLKSFSAECLKAISTKNETDVDQRKPGDGWEIEEDGFEIPATLSKLSNENISQEEQSFELDQVEFRPGKREKNDGWTGWGTWGVSSLLSTATDSVSTFSNQVTAGLSTMIETTVGAPNPENLASATSDKQNLDSKALYEEKTPDEENKMKTNYGGLGSIVSGVSFFGSTVINHGLDTLETLGKKTMEVLQDGDPRLLKKRAMLFPNQDKPVLSQILREAKEKADHSDKEKEEKEVARKIHFESLFDDFQGMVHLEALEMLSTQCELKLQSLLLAQSGSQLADLQETLSQVRDLCELADEEEECEVLNQEQFAEQVTKCVKGLNVNITAAKIIQVNDTISTRLNSLSTDTATVINQTAISSLAEFTAIAMECFHKSAELLLAKSLRNTPDEAENYVELTNHLCARVSAIANEFTQLLTKHHPIANSSLITNTFLEASNCCSYIRNSCQLLIPILQVGTISS